MSAIPSFDATADPLLRYLARQDESFHWAVVGRRGSPDGAERIEVDLCSQTWQQIPWRHRLVIVQPAALTSGPARDTALLFITGDKDEDEAAVRMMEWMAAATGVRGAVLYNVPNQPLFEDLSEDALIARTFVRFLETGDETWPLLFPMTRSAAAAMTVLEQFTASSNPPVTRFVASGASKRGWTTWLIGAFDRRVIGIAPMVYNNLNIPAQMRRQLESFTTYSEEIGDYVEAGLPAQMTTPAGQLLGAMVDPYSYRAQLQLPKLLINGANDPYWPLDAANLYFDDLVGPKCQLMVPNAGHSIEDGDRVLNALAAFLPASAAGETLPVLEASFSERNGEGVLDARSNQPPISMTGWTATAPTQDFREALWTPHGMQGAGDGFRLAVPLPEDGYLALFAEAEYRHVDLGLSYRLSSPLAILPGALR